MAAASQGVQQGVVNQVDDNLSEGAGITVEGDARVDVAVDLVGRLPAFYADRVVIDALRLVD